MNEELTISVGLSERERAVLVEVLREAASERWVRPDHNGYHTEALTIRALDVAPILDRLEAAHV